MGACRPNVPRIDQRVDAPSMADRKHAMAPGGLYTDKAFSYSFWLVWQAPDLPDRLRRPCFTSQTCLFLSMNLGRDRLRRYGYSRRGKPPRSVKLLVHDERVSVIAAMSSGGMETLRVVSHTVDGDTISLREIYCQYYNVLMEQTTTVL